MSPVGSGSGQTAGASSRQPQLVVPAPGTAHNQDLGHRHQLAADIPVGRMPGSRAGPDIPAERRGIGAVGDRPEAGSLAYRNPWGGPAEFPSRIPERPM